MAKMSGVMALALTTSCAACSPSFDVGFGSTATVVLLTSARCPAGPVMRMNLEQALRSSNLPTVYDVVDIDALPATDPRVTYGAPTVLVDGNDLFGRVPPFAPSGRAGCRSFGRADAAAWPATASEIAMRLKATY